VCRHSFALFEVSSAIALDDCCAEMNSKLFIIRNREMINDQFASLIIPNRRITKPKMNPFSSETM